jgi:hypothetical protein
MPVQVIYIDLGFGFIVDWERYQEGVRMGKRDGGWLEDPVRWQLRWQLCQVGQEVLVRVPARVLGKIVGKVAGDLAQAAPVAGVWSATKSELEGNKEEVANNNHLQDGSGRSIV